MDWSEAEDNLLLTLSKQYSYNWPLIADVFNGSTVRISTDMRDNWDVYYRWDKKFGPGSQTVDAAGTSSAGAAGRKDLGKLPTKFDGTKKDLRHHVVYDEMRSLQKRREMQGSKPSGKLIRRLPDNRS